LLSLCDLVVAGDQVHSKDLDAFVVIHDNSEHTILRIDFNNLFDRLSECQFIFEVKMSIGVFEDFDDASLLWWSLDLALGRVGGSGLILSWLIDEVKCKKK